MKDGTFRKKKGFTAVQNTVAKDKTLSMKAKGLYLLIQAYITMPGTNWKKSDFANMCMEGSKAFNSGWDELKKKGYLHVHIYSGNGAFRNEYELLDEKAPGPHTFYYNGKGELTKTNEDRYNQNGSNADGTDGNGIDGEGCDRMSSDGESGNNNKTIALKPDNKNNNNPSVNPSISDGIDGWSNIVEYRSLNGKLPYAEILQSEKVRDEFVDKLFEACGSYKDSFNQSIFETLFIAVREMLDEIPTKIQGRKVPAELILRLIDKRMEKMPDFPYLGICRIVESTIADYMQAAERTEIKSEKEYLKACFYNALASGSLDVETKIAHDFGIDHMK